MAADERGQRKEGVWDSADLVVLLYHHCLAYFPTSKRKTQKSELSLCLSTSILSYLLLVTVYKF